MKNGALRSSLVSPNIVDGIANINKIKDGNSKNQTNKISSCVASNHAYDINNIIISNSDKDPCSYTFNFDKKILNLNDAYINEKEIIYDSTSSSANFMNLIEFHNINILELDGSLKAYSEKNNQKFDHGVRSNAKIDNTLLKEKKQLEIKEIRMRATRKRNLKISSSGSDSYNDNIDSVLFIKENGNDPLSDWKYAKFHKSKLKIEKNFASDDKSKFSEEVSGMSDVFTRLINMLKQDKQCIYKKHLVDKLVNSDSLDSNQVEISGFSPDSSLIIAYFNYIFFPDESPNYSKLLHLLDNEYDYATHSYINGSSNNNDISKQNQDNTLKTLITKNPSYRESFKSLLLNDKGFKEQFEFKHMRSNTSINFKPEYYDDFDNHTETGKGSAVFNDLSNFCRIIRSKKHSIYENSDKLSNNISLEKDVYSVRFTTKDRLLIKTLQRFTYLNPSILKMLKTEEGILETETFRKNVRILQNWNKVLNYICHNLLFTLFEMFKILKFFYGYWVNKNEYLTFTRLIENQKLNKRIIPDELNSLAKKQKNRKKVKIFNKFDNYLLFNLCLSDNENDEGLDEERYSDLENDISIDNLREKRRVQQNKKFVNNWNISEHIEENAQPVLKKVIFKVNSKKRVIFDPRFDTRIFNTTD